jgi:cyclase
MSSANLLPGSKHYTLEQLADGVYTAIARYGAGAVCNAGIVDLGEPSLVFDAFQTPQAAVDLQYACQKLTGRSASYVVNSHWHGDHITATACSRGRRASSRRRRRAS